MNKLGRLDK